MTTPTPWGSLLDALRRMEFRPPPFLGLGRSEGGGDGASESIQRSLVPPAGASLRVENVDGEVEVGPADGDEIEVRAEKRVTGRTGSLDDAELRIGSDEGTVLVAVEHHRSDAVEVTVDLRVGVPAGTALDRVETVNGPVTVAGVAGDAHVESVNGPVAVRDVDGTLSLETVNGRIEAAGVRDVRRARATNGSIELALDALDGETAVETTAGAVTVRVPASADPRLRLDAGLGSTSVEGFPSENSRSTDPGEDGGANVLRASTLTGSITVVGT